MMPLLLAPRQCRSRHSKQVYWSWCTATCCKLSLRYLPVCVYVRSILVDYVLCLSLESTQSGLGNGTPWSYVLVHRCRIPKLVSCIYLGLLVGDHGSLCPQNGRVGR